MSATGGSASPDAPAPALLGRAIDAAPPLEPLRHHPSVSTIHQTWALVHAGDPAAAPAGRGGWRRRVQRVLTAAPTAPGEDRALIGELIRATDALAARCDELAGRVMDLEQALTDVVDVLGADLTRLAAEVASRPGAGPRLPDG